MAALAFLTISVLLNLVVATVLLAISRIIYRLTLHPLAKFPGPKLAGATNLYAASYDLFNEGLFVKKLTELHDQYGPIVRAWPNQLHIRDLDAYNQVFKIGTKFDKEPTFYSNPFLRGSLLTILDLKSAKSRKDMYQPYFSKAAIQRVESLIQDKVSNFLNILKDAASENKVIDLSLGYRCLTADVVMNYCYQKTFGALDAPDFAFPLIVALEEALPAGQWTIYFSTIFGFINRITEILPSMVIEKFAPPVAANQWMLLQCRNRILSLQESSRSSHGSFPTIFDTTLSPDPAKGQYTPSVHELTADAFLMFAAGTDTTANTLSQGTWHVLRNPGILKRLKDELRQAMPKKDVMFDWATLENLPYLRAVIKESLRFSYGVPGRLPRIVPPSGATFCGRAIPPGTVVPPYSALNAGSMTNPRI
ncbi:MAG: hypothetical protein M1830_010370 [Pleopsidium flavum]|nr:MAG: hypothetical protein M1830_010370 [Pleopsidium flavum]